MGKSSSEIFLSLKVNSNASSAGDVIFIDPKVRGLSIEAAAIRHNDHPAEEAVSLKSNTEPRIIEVEIDLLNNLERFKSLVSWFEETSVAPPCAASLKRSGAVSISGPAFKTQVAIYGVIPVSWNTSTLDNGRPPRATIKFACDSISFNPSDEIQLDTYKSIGSGSNADRPAKWSQLLKRTDEATHDIQIESCSGFGQSIEVERVWDVDACKLIHTVVPGRLTTNLRFVVKHEASGGVLNDLAAWYQAGVTRGGIPLKRSFTYEFSLSGQSEHQIVFTIERANITSLEFFDIEPGVDPAMAFALEAAEVSVLGVLRSNDGSSHAAPPAQNHSGSGKGSIFGTSGGGNANHKQPTSLLAKLIYPSFAKDGRRDHLPALLLRPRFIVPNVSRKSTRPDLKLNLNSTFHNVLNDFSNVAFGSVHVKSAPLAHPDGGAQLYACDKTKNPQTTTEVSFYVYASNPWPTHRTAHDLRKQLENVLFPIFYACRSDKEEKDTNLDIIRTFLDKFGLDEKSQGLGWRELDDETQLPASLMNRISKEELRSKAHDNSSFNIPIVISLKPAKWLPRTVNPFASHPITGTLESATYSIDQWLPSGKPWRAMVTLGIQALRGLECSPEDLYKSNPHDTLQPAKVPQ